MQAGANEEARKSYARALYHYLSGAPLLLALADPMPAGGAPVKLQAAPETLARAAVSVDPQSGHCALPAFIDLESLNRRFPGAAYVEQDVEAVLRLFLSGRYDSLFLNPEGKWMELDRESAGFLLSEGKPRSI